MPGVSFINSINDISHENFKKHFTKLTELIDLYNEAVATDREKWTSKNITALTTVKTANTNPETDW